MTPATPMHPSERQNPGIYRRARDQYGRETITRVDGLAEAMARLADIVEGPR